MDSSNSYDHESTNKWEKKDEMKREREKEKLHAFGRRDSKIF